MSTAIIAQGFVPGKPQIKSYAELNLEAMRRRMERPIMAWSLGRYLSQGCPWVSMRSLREFVERQGLCHRQTLWRAIQRGMGTLFRAKTRGRLYLRGARQVAETWGVELTQHPVLLPVEKLSSMRRIRQGLVASFCANKARTISAVRFGELVNRTPRWARRYLNQPDIDKQSNVMVSAGPTPRFGQAVDPDLAAKGYHRTKINGRWTLVRHLPNTYRAAFATAPYGIVKRPIGSSSMTQGAIRRRVFYHEPRAQARAVNRLQDGETVFLALENTTEFWGRACWHGWTRQWGVVGRC